MHYQMTTYQGIIINLGSDFKFKSYLEQINARDVISVALGTISTLKSNIRFVKPIYEEGETPEGEELTVYLNSGVDPIKAHSIDFDSLEISKQYNDRQNTFILIGDTAIHRNEYSLVMPTPAVE